MLELLSGGDLETWTTVSLVVAVMGGITLFFTFLNPKNEKNYTGFVKQLYDFLSFKTMFLETLLIITYLILAIFITLSSFSLIEFSFLSFLITLIVGNLVLRMGYEASLIFLKINKNVKEINDKMAK